jgi:hypothetical protein
MHPRVDDTVRRSWPGCLRLAPTSAKAIGNFVQLTVKYLQVPEDEQPAANVTKGSA